MRPPRCSSGHDLSSGYAGHGQEGSTRIHTRTHVVVDTSANRDLISERFVKRHNLRSFAASALMNVALAVGKWLTANRLVAITLDFGART